MIEADLIFINWNSADLILPAVKTLKENGVSVNYKITVIDNGSTDDSCELIRREVPEADVVEVGWNSGFAAAVNRGLMETSAPYAFILNTDIEFNNDVVGIMISALKNDEKAVLACPELIRPDGSLQAAVVPVPNLLSELTSRSLGRRLLKYDREKTSRVPSVVGPCMAIDRERLNSLPMQEPAGLFDDSFFFFLEETDFCKRINNAGAAVLFVPEAKLVHAQGESANKRPTKARIQFYESRYKYFAKHYGKAAVALLFVGCLLRLVVNMAAQFLFGICCFWNGSNYFDKGAVYFGLLKWHLRFCPKGWSFDQRHKRK